MNRTAIALAVLLSVLLAGYTAASHASRETALVQVLRAPRPTRNTDQPLMVIPDNTLTGHGAIATANGVAHYQGV